MKSKIVPSLYIYFIAAIVSLLAFLFKMDNVYFVCKPIFVPAIYFYYLQISQFKPKFWFSIAVLMSYCSDMMVLFQFDNVEIPVALLNIGMYTIFIGYFLKLIRIQKIKSLKIVYFGLSLILLLGLAYFVLSLMEGIDELRFIIYAVYGLILSLMSAVGIFNYLHENNYSISFYGLILCICCVTSDVFFVLYNFYIKMDVLILINLIAQFISYYYMVNFITTKESRDAIRQA